MRLSALLPTCLAPILCLAAPGAKNAGVPSDLMKDHTGNCVVPNPKRPTGTICGKPRNYPNDYDNSQVRNFYVSNAHECAQRCFDPQTFRKPKHCTSFDYQNQTFNENGDRLCSVYDIEVPFVSDPTTDIYYWSSDCFKVRKIDDAPIQDGDFSQPTNGGDPWSGGNNHFDYFGDYADMMYARVSTSLDGPGYSYQGHTTQTVNTCRGSTYQIDYYAADGKNNGYGDFYVYVNGVLLYSRSIDDDMFPLKERPPLYFQSSTDSANIRFSVRAYLGAGESPFGEYVEEGYEFLDNIVVQAVYAGTLPPGTNVTVA